MKTFDFKGLYKIWGLERRRQFGEYLLYLHELNSSGKLEDAYEDIRRKHKLSKRTVQRIMSGPTYSFKASTLNKLGALVLYFEKMADDGVAVDDFETWLQRYPASGEQDQDDSNKAARAEAVGSHMAFEETVADRVSIPKWLWLAGGGVFAAFVAVIVALRFTCILPGQCSPQNIDYWGIETSYFMRVNHNGYAMEEKFSGPRIVRLREPIIYLESDDRIGFADTNITFINRTDGSVIETHEFEGDAKTYRQPYVDDRTVSAEFDFEVIECFAVRLEDEGLWVREFKVKHPDAQRLRELVSQERRDDFNLVSVFEPGPVLSRSQLDCPSDLRTDAMYQEFQNSGVGEPLVDIASAYVDPLSDVDLSQVRPEFEASWYQGTLRVWLKTLTGLPNGLELELSNDGEVFEQTTNDQNFLPGDQFLLRSQSHGLDGKQISIDLTEQARAAAEAELASGLGSYALDCFPGYCELPRNAYCNGNWSKMAFGREEGLEEVSVDLAQCAQETTSHKICLSTPLSLFPTGPSQRIYAAMYDDSGEKFSFPLTVSDWDHSKQANAIELKTVDPSEEAPFAVAWYEPGFGLHTNDFRIQFAAGGCRPSLLALEEGMNSVFYDVDGKGDVRGQLRYFSVPRPETETVKITFRGKNGQVYGPYTYAMSYRDVIQASIDAAERPETIQCRRDLNNRFDIKSWYYTCQIQPNWVQLLGWANVAQVRFGQKADELTDILEPSVDIDRLLKIFAEHDSRQIPMIAEYLPDLSWREVYFQIVFRDGTETLVQRIVLPDPL